MLVGIGKADNDCTHYLKYITGSIARPPFTSQADFLVYEIFSTIPSDT